MLLYTFLLTYFIQLDHNSTRRSEVLELGQESVVALVEELVQQSVVALAKPLAQRLVQELGLVLVKGSCLILDQMLVE